MLVNVAINKIIFCNHRVISDRFRTWDDGLENCHRTHEMQMDAGEDLLTRLVPVEDLPRLVKENKIRHSVILAALHYFAMEE